MKFPSSKQSSRPRTLVLSIAACLAASSFIARADISTNDAVQNVDAGSAFGGYTLGGAGFGFKSGDDLTITALGYAIQNTSSAPFSVEVLDADGNLLAWALLTPDMAAGGNYVFSDISPITLPAGTTNFITSYDEDQFEFDGTRFWFGNAIDELEPNRGSFDVAAGLEYLGASVETTFWGGTASPAILFVGPSFRFFSTPTVHPSLLHISMTTSNTVRVSWPASDTIGQLRAGPDLTTALTNVLVIPSVAGTNQVVELPATETQLFFLLQYP